MKCWLRVGGNSYYYHSSMFSAMSVHPGNKSFELLDKKYRNWWNFSKIQICCKYWISYSPGQHMFLSFILKIALKIICLSRCIKLFLLPHTEESVSIHFLQIWWFFCNFKSTVWSSYTDLNRRNSIPRSRKMQIIFFNSRKWFSTSSLNPLFCQLLPVN